MAHVTINQFQNRQYGGVSPFGNLTSYAFPLQTGGNGGALDANFAGPLGAGLVVDLGQLPEGMRLEDASVLVSVGMSPGITGMLGFRYEDRVDDRAVPQDAAYFASAIDLTNPGRKRATGAKLVTLPKPARLILTIQGRGNSKASDIKVLVTGELTGNR